MDISSSDKQLIQPNNPPELVVLSFFKFVDFTNDPFFTFILQPSVSPTLTIPTPLLPSFPAIPPAARLAFTVRSVSFIIIPSTIKVVVFAILPAIPPALLLVDETSIDNVLPSASPGMLQFVIVTLLLSAR